MVDNWIFTQTGKNYEHARLFGDWFITKYIIANYMTNYKKFIQKGEPTHKYYKADMNLPEEQRRKTMNYEHYLDALDFYDLYLSALELSNEINNLLYKMETGKTIEEAKLQRASKMFSKLIYQTGQFIYERKQPNEMTKDEKRLSAIYLRTQLSWEYDDLIDYFKVSERTIRTWLSTKDQTIPTLPFKKSPKTTEKYVRKTKDGEVYGGYETKDGKIAPVRRKRVPLVEAERL